MAQIPSSRRPPGPPPCELGLIIAVDGSTSPPRRMLRVRGELDIATAALFAHALDRAGTPGEVELDLSGLDFCDVVGMAAIERSARRLAARGCRLTLRGTAGLHLLLSVPGLFEVPAPEQLATLPDSA
jgi:sulfate permease, SulP family